MQSYHFFKEQQSIKKLSASFQIESNLIVQSVSYLIIKRTEIRLSYYEWAKRMKFLLIVNFPISSLDDTQTVLKL